MVRAVLLSDVSFADSLNGMPIVENFIEYYKAQVMRSIIVAFYLLTRLLGYAGGGLFFLWDELEKSELGKLSSWEGENVKSEEQESPTWM